MGGRIRLASVFTFGNETLNTLAVIALVLAVGFAVVEYIIYKKCKKIAAYLTLAERDFNALVASGLGHGGRRERVAERREWNEMVNPVAVNVLGEKYRTVAHELIAANEKELGGKGATMGKATITAFLLRELYNGNVRNAQIKIIAETRNNDERKTPYIAPGIDVLVGFHKFDKKELRFEPGAGVDKWLLKRVVKDWNFPREIRWIKTDSDGSKVFREPMDALGQLYQQNIEAT